MAPMLTLLSMAAAIDLRSRRIPNWLTASLIATGLVQSSLVFSSVSVGQAWAGLGVGFGLTFVMFAVGAMGGGDVKLFAGIGAWVGPLCVVQIFAVEAVIGMVVVVAQAVHAGRLRALARGSAVIAMNAAVRGDLSCPEEPMSAANINRLPYAVPTLLATVTVLLLAGRRYL